ncbi:hypothetical protein [Rhizobium dioscoreae]|uniref:hypothetical protein n=1 Tax=Rhizobium TaxID=379 RepID=UPI0013B02B4A|nr:MULTISPECIES: hypothetical protein [Rhizobium]
MNNLRDVRWDWWVSRCPRSTALQLCLFDGAKTQGSAVCRDYGVHLLCEPIPIIDTTQETAGQSIETPNGDIGNQETSRFSTRSKHLPAEQPRPPQVASRRQSQRSIPVRAWKHRRPFLRQLLRPNKCLSQIRRQVGFINITLDAATATGVESENEP